MMKRPTLNQVLVGVALTAALLLIAQSEWRLALAVGWPPYVAWLAPVALDTYALVAVLQRRDLGVAVLVSAVSVFASHGLYAAPAAWTSGIPAEGSLLWELAATCSVVPLLVAWRVERIIHRAPTVIQKGVEIAETLLPAVAVSPEPRPPVLSARPPASKLAAKMTREQGVALVLAEMDAQGQVWTPDYDALQKATGYARSWCEKRVQEAREQRQAGRLHAVSGGR